MNLWINVFHFTNVYSTDISDICLCCNNLLVWRWLVCLFVCFFRMNVLIGLLYLVWHLFWIVFSVIYVAWQVQFLACRVEITTVGIKWYHLWKQNIERYFMPLLFVFWVPLLWPSALSFENFENKAVWVSTPYLSWHHCCDLKFQFHCIFMRWNNNINFGS